MGSTLERGALLHKRYRIVEILGQGGMGSVYHAVDENLGVDVAVKENLFTSEEYSRQFRLEAVLLANLRHPHLPRVTDHFVIDNQGQYLIMDYIEGEDLRQRMERVGSITEQEALLIGVAMCDALQYLHTRKPAVIHRDVKPGNVRITADGHIYLVDFGLAKLVKGNQATTTGARAMTPGYSPPEQYGTARTDPRTDVYSLGATLYAALSGTIPEDGLARAMDNVELTPLRKRNSNISRKLASAIEKAMAVRPEDRFQSAEEFKQALVSSNVKTQQLEKLKDEAILAVPKEATPTAEEKNLERELPPGDVPPSEPPSSGRRGNSNRRRGWWVFFSFFLLAVLAAVLALVYYWNPVSSSISQFLVSPTRSASPTNVPTDGSSNVALDLTPTRTPTRTSARTSTRTPTRTYTSTPSRTRTATLTSTPTVMLLPSLTPSLTETVTPSATETGGGYGQLAFASTVDDIPQIFLINVDGTNLTQLTTEPGGACQPAWSPDGARLVYISPCPKMQADYPGAKMFVINADGTNPLGLPTTPQGDFDPAWSPDGTQIAFTSLRTGTDQIFVMNLADYTVTQLTDKSNDTRIPDWSRQPAWSPDGTQILYSGHGPLTNALQVWLMSNTGSDKELLILRGPSNWNFYPTWSPDGKTVLFNETNGPQTLGWLMRFDYENRETATAVYLRPGTNGNYGSYSPDGIWVVYESIDVTNPNDTGYYLYVMKVAAGNAAKRLRTSGELNFDPAWRPGP